MEALDVASHALMWLIRAGVGFRVAYCIFKVITSDDETPRYRKRIAHTMVFYVIAESVFGIEALVLGYFGR